MKYPKEYLEEIKIRLKEQESLRQTWLYQPRRPLGRRFLMCALESTKGPKITQSQKLTRVEGLCYLAPKKT